MLHVDVLVSILLKGLIIALATWTVLSFYFSAPVLRDWVDQKRELPGILNEGLSCWHCLSFHVCLYLTLIVSLASFEGGSRLGSLVLTHVLVYLIAVSITHLLNKVCEIDPLPNDLEEVFKVSPQEPPGGQSPWLTPGASNDDTAVQPCLPVSPSADITTPIGSAGY